MKIRKIALAALILAGSASAVRAGVLIGSWDVVCKHGHVDRVTDLTRSHSCSHGDDGDVVNDGAARVKCPYCGTVDLVSGTTASHYCSNCHRQVRR